MISTILGTFFGSEATIEEGCIGPKKVDLEES
jgi:hypothetical protein